jgi:hypothetical protein
LLGFPLKGMKWTTDFHVVDDPSIIPHMDFFQTTFIALFHKADPLTLYAIALAIGWPLKIDEAMANLTRPSVARVYVEVD